MERETGFEPATSTLARSHSTTELFPLREVQGGILANKKCSVNLETSGDAAGMRNTRIARKNADKIMHLSVLFCALRVFRIQLPLDSEGVAVELHLRVFPRGN